MTKLNSLIELERDVHVALLDANMVRVRSSVYRELWQILCSWAAVDPFLSLFGFGCEFVDIIGVPRRSRVFDIDALFAKLFQLFDSERGWHRHLKLLVLGELIRHQMVSHQ